MKLGTIAVGIMALVLPSLGQTDKRWFETAEGYFKNSSSQALSVDQLISGRVSAAGKQASNHQKFNFGTPVAALITDGDFAFRGEEYNAALIIKRDLPQSVYVHGQLLFPGPSGQQSMDSRIEYFSSLQGDGSGKFRRGLSDGDIVPVFAQRIMGTYNAGDYLLHVVIIDANGEQHYEAFSRFSVSLRSTPVNLSSFRILSARSQYVQFTERHTRVYQVELTGRFPVNLPLDVTATIPGFARFDAVAVSLDGKTLQFRYETNPISAPNVLNLTVYSSFFSEAITLRHGLNLDAAIGAP